MIAFALTTLQAGVTPLIPFVDDGGTKTRPVAPRVIAIVKGRAVFATGSRSYRLLIVDAKEGRTVYLDRNDDGRPEVAERIPMERQQGAGNDGRPVWIYSGILDLPSGTRYGLNAFVSTTSDPGYAAVRDKIRLFPLSGYVGRASFGAKTMRIGIRGDDLATGTLFVDRDSDGLLGTVPAEAFALRSPFNLNGTTYRVASFTPGKRPTIRFAVSSKRVAEVPMPPDLRVGKIVPSIAGTTLDGRKVSFPKSWSGKTVLLDVWATWCGPCVAEMPYMKAAYAKYHGKGLEIVSFSIDDPNMRAQVAAFTRQRGASWVQVYQGMGWKSPVCQRFNIRSIPFFLLVDGSTGRILATESNLRGPNLDPTIAAALARRR